MQVPITHLKRILNGELSLGSLSGGLNLDGGVDLDLIRSVRHPADEDSSWSVPGALISQQIAILLFLETLQGAMSSSAFVDVRGN